MRLCVFIKRLIHNNISFCFLHTLIKSLFGKGGNRYVRLCKINFRSGTDNIRNSLGYHVFRNPEIIRRVANVFLPERVAANIADALNIYSWEHFVYKN